MIDPNLPQIAQDHFNTLKSLETRLQKTIECKDKLSEYPNVPNLNLPEYNKFENCPCIHTVAVFQQANNDPGLTDLYFVKCEGQIHLLTPCWMSQPLRKFPTFHQAKNEDSFPIDNDLTYFGCTGEGLFFLAYWPNTLNSGKLFRKDQPDIFDQCFGALKKSQASSVQNTRHQPNIPQIAETNTINIRFLFDITEYVIQIDANATIHDLIQKIKNKIRNKIEKDGDIKILYNAQEVKYDDKCTLQQCGIRDNAHLTVQVAQNLANAQQDDNTNLLNKQTKIVNPFDLNSVKTSMPTILLNKKAPQGFNPNPTYSPKFYNRNTSSRKSNLYSHYSNSNKGSLYSHYQNSRKSNLKNTLKATGYIPNNSNISKQPNNSQLSHLGQHKSIVRSAFRQSRNPSQIITSKRSITNTNQPSFKNTSQSRVSAVPTQSIIVPTDYLKQIRKSYQNASASLSQVASMKGSQTNVDKLVVRSSIPLQQSGVPLKNKNVVRPAKIEKVQKLQLANRYPWDRHYLPCENTVYTMSNGNKIYGIGQTYSDTHITAYMFSNEPIYQCPGGGFITTGFAKYSLNDNPSVYYDPNVQFWS